MDLYSTSRRLNRPFVFDTGYRIENTLPLADRALIGDLCSAALVRVDGVIDWACFPSFDSPSVFGAILDAEKGGFTAVQPVNCPFETLQAYDPDTNVVETLFTVPGEGVMRVTDYMPWCNDPRSSVHEIHRRIECLEGAVAIRVVADPRFDYGRAKTTIEKQDDGLLAKSDSGDTMAIALGASVDWKERPQGGVEAQFNLGRGANRRVWMVFSWDAPEVEPIGAYRPFQQLRDTRHHWREWTRRLDYFGPWRHHVTRSALALKLMTYGPTGAMVAAPTTSLPEWIGGVRNWDYRYTWSRDTALAIRATNTIGYHEEAREFFHFMRRALEKNESLRVMYSIHGDDVPVEEELDLAGFMGSSPVRIGNGAKEQLQLDTAGALIDAAHRYEHIGGAITLRTWRSLKRVIDATAEHWDEPDHGIWEPRAGVRHNVHSKLMCWVSLDRGAKLAAEFGRKDQQQRYGELAHAVKRDILARGLDPSGQRFTAVYGEDRADAALLLMPIYGMLDPKDPRIDKTLSWIRSELGHGPFVYRYHAEDGIAGEEGAFVLCGFWLAEALALAGHLDEAQEVFVAHVNASNHVGLLAEEIDPSTGDALGNFPQAFSHLGLINAANAIDRGLRAAREQRLAR